MGLGLEEDLLKNSFLSHVQICYIDVALFLLGQDVPAGTRAWRGAEQLRHFVGKDLPV